LAYYSASDWQHYRSTRKIISPPASPGPAKSALQPAEEGPLNRVNPGSANADQQANLHAIMRFEDGISSQSSQDEGNVSQDHHLQQQPPMRQSMPAILDERLTTAPLGSTDPFAFYRVLGVEINATVPQINAEYKKLAIQYHPDKYDPTEHEIWTNQFQTLTTIYRTLTDTEERTKYNRQSRLANRNVNVIVDVPLNPQ
jgi:DnaJ-domain-containing protein 1